MQLRIHEGDTCTIVEYTEPCLLSSLLGQAHAGCLPCGGKRRCHACRVRVTGGILPPDEDERRLLTETDLGAHIRYACMTTVTGDADVRLDAMKIRTNGPVRDIPGDPWAIGYLAAIDLGTTTLAGTLVSPEGRMLADAGLANPQCAFGADVLTRAELSLNGGSAELAGAARDGVNALLRTLAKRSGIGTDGIGAVCIAGNTVMDYLLAGKSPTTLVRAPFSMTERFGGVYPAHELGLCTENARCCILPCVSAFIGGDITAGILATALRERREPCLLLDIGTNGETVLWDGRELLCCSAAAGPAFEGSGLSCGMPAQDGAIAHVRLSGGTLITGEVIGQGRARGVCGSGLLDATAVFLDMGLIDETGAVDEDADTEGYITAEGALRIGSTDVVLTQGDIRAVQTAKAAIRSGVETLLYEAGLKAEDVKAVYLAGGFGTYLDPGSACRTGLLPEKLRGRTTAVGNTALAGAVCVGRSRTLRAEAQDIGTSARTVSLAEHSVFAREFIRQMMFPPKNPE